MPRLDRGTVRRMVDLPFLISLYCGARAGRVAAWARRAFFWYCALGISLIVSMAAVHGLALAFIG